jgi:hypothetical protein
MSPHYDKTDLGAVALRPWPTLILIYVRDVRFGNAPARGDGPVVALLRVGTVVRFWIRTREALGSDLGQATGYHNRDFRCSPQLQADSVIVALSGHERFLPKPFQFIINPTAS